MKTAMQKLLDKYVEEKMTTEELGKYVEMSLYIMLNEEREQIEQAYFMGGMNTDRKLLKIVTPSDYFTKTYNQ